MKRKFTETLLKQAIAASKAGRREDARQILQQVIELDPDNEPAWLWLSSVVDEIPQRQHCLEQVLRLNPENSHARAGLAWIRQQEPPEPVLAEAETVSEAATGTKPEQKRLEEHQCPFCQGPVSLQHVTCPHCHHDLIVTCPACETEVDVERRTCQVCGHELGDCDRGAAYFAALGEAYLANLKPELAVDAWQQALRIAPDYPNGHLWLGEAQVASGDLEGARSSFEQAIERATDPASAYRGLGHIYERRHKWDEAQQAYERAVAANEKSASARFDLGRLFMEGNAYQAAFTHLRRATELDPGHAEAWSLLGELYELAEERRKAIKAYERALELNGQSPRKEDAAVQRAAARLEQLRPSLPPSVALRWPETIRQTAALALIPALAALVNGGLRPWQIAPLDFLGVLVAALGAYFWVSATAMPRNPGMRSMLGSEGLSEPSLRTTLGLLGGVFWAVGLLYILVAPALV